MTTLLSVNNYHYYRGGAETVFLRHNELFESIGWRVVPFAMHHPRNLQTAWSRFFIDEIEFGGSYSLSQKMLRVPRVIYSMQARKRLGGLLNAISPDICHAHNIYHHISPSILSLLRQRGVPTVMTLHDLKIACPAYQMLAHDGICERCRGGHYLNVVRHRCIKDSVALSSVVMVEAALHRMLGSYSRFVDRFVVPSRFYAQKLVEWGFPAGAFRHIPNFVDAQAYEPRFEPGERLLYFGRLSREKGLHTLVRAVARVKGRLTLVGTGTEAESLTRLARQLEADVRFAGYLTGPALHAAVREARAVVLPSEWYENAPMSVLEAYALGKPVVGARIGGIPELIQPGITGFQFESADVSSLCRALEDLAATPDARVAEMGRAARTWVAADFSSDAYRERILQVYSELGVSRAVGVPANALANAHASGVASEPP